MRKTLVDVLRERTRGLEGDLVLELQVACGRDDMERRLALLGSQPSDNVSGPSKSPSA